ncbi:MAG TPA: hypothetical protein DEP51_02685 [Clostridiales bacterium]|nr:hypothetical protein [Clostridiales bacterium]
MKIQNTQYYKHFLKFLENNIFLLNFQIEIWYIINTTTEVETIFYIVFQAVKKKGVDNETARKR